MYWIHLDFYFKKQHNEYRFLNEKQTRKFEDLIRNIIVRCGKKIHRKFFLYEPNPHCFLALELRRKSDFRFVNDVLKGIKAPYFIKAVGIHFETHDELNGEGTVSVWNAFTDLFLFHRDNKVSHVIHCCLEPIFAERRLENEFYQKMAVMYQDAQIIDGKKVYLYKDITPETKAELEKYVKKLDLREKIANNR